MENYPVSFTFQSFPALNLEMLWFHKRTILVGFSSRRNSTASGGAKWDLLNAQCPYKTGSSQPAELKPGYWYWLRISSASFTLQSWLASEFFQCYFWAMCCYSKQHPRGAFHVCHVGNMAAFQDEPIQLRLPFPGPNWWTTTPVFLRSPQRGNQSIVAWIWHKSQSQGINSEVLDRMIS